MKDDLDKLLADIGNMMDERHQKYGAGNIARHGIDGILVRIDDKIARIANSKNDFSDESHRDAWRDVVGYGLIALMWLDGRWPGSPVPDAPMLAGAETGRPSSPMDPDPRKGTFVQKPAQQTGKISRPGAASAHECTWCA